MVVMLCNLSGLNEEADCGKPCLLPNQRHTACSVKKQSAKNLASQVVTIHYRFHPLYGQEVEVIFRSKRAGEKVYLISFIDKTNVYLPVWMTDRLIGQHHVVDELPPFFSCTCSLEKMGAVMRSIPIPERMAIVKEGKEISINCHFCRKKYTLTIEDCILFWNQK